jgi:hypothetical protein
MRRHALNLVVFVAACNGADIASIVQAHERAPFRLLIGPTRELTFDEVGKGTQAFYATLFTSKSGKSAIAAMNAAVGASRKQTFWTVGVDRLFAEIFRGYVRGPGTPEISVSALRTS